MSENELSRLVIDLGLKIHRAYGPGLLESVYEKIFCHEWQKTGIPFSNQKSIPLIHDGNKLDIGFRSDVIIDNKVLIDFKSLEIIPPVHFKRFRTYLKLSGLKLGLILNFDVILFKDGIYRIVNGLEDG